MREICCLSLAFIVFKYVGICKNKFLFISRFLNVFRFASRTLVRHACERRFLSSN